MTFDTLVSIMLNAVIVVSRDQTFPAVYRKNTCKIYF